MPTYDFQCDACNHTFEEYQSMMDKPLKKCPQCKKNRLRRLIGTGAAIIFKGAGFYQTDYRSESYKKAASADKPDTASSTTSESKSESKSDSKPAAPAKNESKSAKSDKQ